MQSEGGEQSHQVETQNKPKPAHVSHVQPEPRWPTAVAVLVAGALYAALPEPLSVGPRWLLLAILTVLVIPAMISHRRGMKTLNNVLGFTIEIISTVFLFWSVVMLVRSLPSKEIQPVDLLKSAAVLWICNVVLFALWYWRLDAGGPYERHFRGHHCSGAFLFPPMTQDGRRAVDGPWSPRFIDYLFLAFNTSTALSPTDAPIISRWAKGLVMLQALTSLTIIVVLAARAINML